MLLHRLLAVHVHSSRLGSVPRSSPRQSICSRCRRSCLNISLTCTLQRDETLGSEEAAAHAGRRHLLAAALLALPWFTGRRSYAAPDNEIFMSAEGIAFDYPRDWVVAFDRSTPGPRKADGAVVVVGNFRTFDTVSVFRTEVPPQDRGGGMSEQLGYRLAVEQQQSALSTMRFKMLSSRLVDADGGKQYYDYEYVIETCRGEIIEELGGKIKCLGPQGQDLQTLRRHHVGRGVLVGGWFYALNASAPLERWEELQGQLRNIVGSFRC